MSACSCLDILGTNVFAKAETGIVVANMIAQDGYMSSVNLRPLRYKYLIECMKKVEIYTKRLNADIHCPKFGILRAGGNWDFIYQLIEELWEARGIDVLIYEFTEK